MENRNENDYGEVDEAFERRVKHAVNLREREHIKSFLDQIENEFQAESQTDKVVVRSINSKRWMGIAAALMFMAAAFFTFQNLAGPTAEQVLADFYEPYPNSYNPITRSQVEEINSEVQAFLMYENGQYEEALVYFNQLPNVNDDISMFIAMSKLETGNVAEAKADLKVLIANGNPRLTEAAQWYMAMAYTKEGKLDQAKTYLEKLADQSSTYQEDAQAILDKIK